jgi:hypothetical protein
MGAESEWVEAYEYHRMGLKLSLPGRVGLNIFHNAIQKDGTERLRATGRCGLSPLVYARRGIGQIFADAIQKHVLRCEIILS